jgi:hypothetical protein
MIFAYTTPPVRFAFSGYVGHEMVRDPHIDIVVQHSRQAGKIPLFQTLRKVNNKYLLML